MLIESYVVSVSEVKRCLASLQIDDFIVVSENIFSIREKQEHAVSDLLFDSTPVNHPEALVIVNKEYARNLIFNGESFEFLKKSHDIKNLKGVSLHLTFANPDLISDLQELAIKKEIDGVIVKCVTHQTLLAVHLLQRQRFQDNEAVISKAISIYTKA